MIALVFQSCIRPQTLFLTSNSPKTYQTSLCMKTYKIYHLSTSKLTIFHQLAMIIMAKLQPHEQHLNEFIHAKACAIQHQKKHTNHNYHSMWIKFCINLHQTHQAFNNYETSKKTYMRVGIPLYPLMQLTPIFK